MMRQWMKRPGSFLCRKMPGRLRTHLMTKLTRSMRGQRVESEEERFKRGRVFLEEELAIFFWGFILTLVLGLILLIRGLCMDHAILLSRNPFGQGQRQQELLLKNKKEEKSVSVTIEEQEIAQDKIDALFEQCFEELKKHMCGKNPSLDQVNRPLCFDEELAGFPFEITYQPEDYALIEMSGEPGEEAAELKGDAVKKTKIKVTAAYGRWEKTRDYGVTIISPEHKKISVYDKALGRLNQLEASSRDRKQIVIPAQVSGLDVILPGDRNMEYAFFFLVLVGPLVLIFHRYSRQKEEAEKQRKEAAEDFPVIVHLLTLYMKAGSSFASAIHRIGSNYMSAAEVGKRRLAFDEIVWMDRQMQMGVSQKEACTAWGSRSTDAMYRKLSVTLVQLLSKGSKEADRILGDLERDAFDQRIDQARKAGKETETRLLFPMIVLLCLVMVVVLFPAVIQFQGF